MMPSRPPFLSSAATVPTSPGRLRCCADAVCEQLALQGRQNDLARVLRQPLRACGAEAHHRGQRGASLAAGCLLSPGTGTALPSIAQAEPPAPSASQPAAVTAALAHSRHSRQPGLLTLTCRAAPAPAQRNVPLIVAEQITKEDDANWPEPDKVGRQELEVILGNDHVSFTTTKLGSVLQVRGRAACWGAQLVDPNKRLSCSSPLLPSLPQRLAS